MIILLTEKRGQPALINTDFMVCATVEMKGPVEVPESTVVSLDTGSAITVREHPSEILAIIAKDDSVDLAIDYEGDLDDIDLEAPDQSVTTSQEIEVLPLQKTPAYPETWALS